MTGPRDCPVCSGSGYEDLIATWLSTRPSASLIAYLLFLDLGVSTRPGVFLEQQRDNQTQSHHAKTERMRDLLLFPNCCIRSLDLCGRVQHQSLVNLSRTSSDGTVDDQSPL